MNSEQNECEAILNELDAINTQSQQLEEEQAMLGVLVAQSKLEELHTQFFAELDACLEEGSVESLLRAKEGFNAFIDALVAHRIEE
jgi:hypothetical protein